MKIPPFLLERFFAPHEFTVRHVLCASNCETMTPRRLLELSPGTLDRLLDQPLHYSPMEGLPELRGAVAGRYASADAEHVLITTGGGSAIEAVSLALFERGDRVAVVTPSYQSLAEWPRLLGCEVVELPLLDTGSRWQLDLDHLETRLSERPTAALVLDCPNSPTGYLPTRPELDAVLETARRHGTRVVCDETFRELEHEEEHRLPSALDLDPEVVALGGVSKSLGLPGLRIGWVASRAPGMIERLAGVLDYTTKDASVVSQILATVAVEHADRILAENRSILREQKAMLAARFAAHAEIVRLNLPDAGAVAFPRLHHSIDGAAFVQGLIEDDVLLLPGTVFGADGQYFRIGFGHRDFAPGLDVLSRHLAAGAGATRGIA